MPENRIIVVEDDTFTRSTVCAALKLHGFVVVAESESASAALELTSKLLPSVALLDLDLGKGPTGVDLAHGLRKIKHDIGIVFLTSYDDPRLLRQNLPALPLGSQYLVKKSITDITTVTRSIRKAQRIGQELNRTSTPARSIPGNQSSILSSVQIETLRLVSEGLTNSEIAKLRDISEKSVEQTINRIVKALELPKNPSHNQRVHLARVFFRMSGAPPSE